MDQDRYVIRNMTLVEVEEIAAPWAAAEGWNPGLHEAACFHGVDPEGFLVGLLDGEPIATIAAAAYDDAFGFIGFYIVRSDRRGQGHGLRIWRAAMARLGERNIGLDGVVEQQDNYRKSGFALAYGNIRYEAEARPAPPAGPGIVAFGQAPFDDIARYDAALFPAPRAGFLRCWAAQPQSLALAAVADGRVAGYGVIRQCRVGHKIGPLFADTPELAERLYLALQNHARPGDKVYLDVPEVNAAAMALAQAHGMAKVFGTARMYTQAQPDIDLNRIYGVTSFELG